MFVRLFDRFKIGKNQLFHTCVDIDCIVRPDNLHKIVILNAIDMFWEYVTQHLADVKSTQ